MISLERKHPSDLTSLEEHHAFSDQGCPLLEHNICHYEVFSDITPEKPSNFIQSLKVPNRVNWIKGEFAKYCNNSSFDFLVAPFPSANLPSTTHVLRSVLSPSIKNISDKIYRYCPYHCYNGAPQVKVIGFEQYSSPVLASPILRIIIHIDATYYLTIGITYVTNAFQNTLKVSSNK